MLSADATPSPHQSHDFVGGLKNWWAMCPLFTRCVMFFSTGLCILVLFSDIQVYLVNVPEKTIGEFQITRLIFCPFTFETVAELLFGLLAYLPLVSEQEKQWGTLKTLTDFFIKNLEINIVFLIVCYIFSWPFSFLSSFFLTLKSYGLWSIFFAYLIEKYMDHHDGVTLFLSSPFHIATKYYPIALFVLFSVITEEFRLDILIASLLGFLHHKYLNVFYNELLSDRKISTWEASSVATWLRTLPHYASPGNMPGALIDSYDQGHSANRGYGGPNYATPQANAYDSEFGGIENKGFGQDAEDLAGDAEKH